MAKIFNITNIDIFDCGSLYVKGEIEINGQEYFLNVDKNVYQGEWEIDVCLFPKGKDHWFKAENVKDRLPWNKYSMLSFDNEQALALAVLAMSDRKIQRKHP